MCGIVAVTGYKKALPLLINGLEKLEYRGYDSAGIAIINSETNCISCNIAEGKLKNFLSNLNDHNITGTVGIGHTRWATHGSVSEINAHPHIAGNVAIVHNGIIENFQEIRNTLEAKGRKFLSQTDSEVIAHLFDTYLRDDNIPLEQITMNVLNELEGAYAFVVLLLNYPDTLIAARNASPLAIGEGDGLFSIGSDAIALAGAGVGIGIIFGNYLSGAMRNPSAAQKQFPNLLLGFALAEATGLFGLVVALIILFAF